MSGLAYGGPEAGAAAAAAVYCRMLERRFDLLADPSFGMGGVDAQVGVGVVTCDV